MNFTTIMLGHKKRQVRLQADVSYDPFQIFPDLQHVKDNNLFHIDEGDVFYDFIGDQGPLDLFPITSKICWKIME